MAGIPKHLLIAAFLGAAIREEKDREERGRTKEKRLAGGKRTASYSDLEKRWGTHKFNLLKLYHGGTVGLDVILQISEARFFDSFDSMVSSARHWWAGLSPERRAEVEQWAAANDPRVARPKSRRPPAPLTSEDAVEIRRLEEGTRPRGRDVILEHPQSGSFRHRR